MKQTKFECANEGTGPQCAALLNRVGSRFSRSEPVVGQARLAGKNFLEIAFSTPPFVIGFRMS